MIKAAFYSFAVEYTPVFLRIDANIPIIDGIIQSDFRLQSIRPTLDWLLQKKAIVVLATHIGRPQHPSKALSTEQLIPWFKKHGYPAMFAASLDKAHQLIHQKHPLIILENLRFFKEEQEGSMAFAQQLAQLASYYIDDAFATLHLKDTSIYLWPTLFPRNKRSIGLLVEKEIEQLTLLLNKPRTEYTFILGGGKITTKIPLIEHFIQKVETLILCPALVFTFLKAKGISVGRSLVDDTVIDVCAHIINQAKKHNTTIIYPVDYQIAEKSIAGKLSYTTDALIPVEDIGISVGPRSIEMITAICQKSSTIFYNGLIGIPQRPETTIGSQQIITAITQSSAYSVIAGGDSIGLIEKDQQLTIKPYLSTGGGATLCFLSEEPLPGLEALM